MVLYTAWTHNFRCTRLFLLASASNSQSTDNIAGEEPALAIFRKNIYIEIQSYDNYISFIKIYL